MAAAVAAAPAHQEAIVAVCAWCRRQARGFYDHRWRPAPRDLLETLRAAGLATDGICEDCRPLVAPGAVATQPCCTAHAGLERLRLDLSDRDGTTDGNSRGERGPAGGTADAAD